METPLEYEEREAEEDRNEKHQRELERFLPHRGRPRTSDEILADAREMYASLSAVSDRTSCMLGALAKQIEILELDRLDT